jgi:hypothetical protein
LLENDKVEKVYFQSHFQSYYFRFSLLTHHQNLHRPHQNCSHHAYFRLFWHAFFKSKRNQERHSADCEKLRYSLLENDKVEKVYSEKCSNENNIDCSEKPESSISFKMQVL